ncbi:lipid A-modifier LpxR family protein [Thermodesulfobacteriota bacterium]
MKRIFLLTAVFILMLSGKAFSAGGHYVDIENDVFLSSLALGELNEDRDYTMGVRLALTGDWADESLFTPLDALDLAIDENLNGGEYTKEIFSRQFILGSENYTPDDLREYAPIYDDRPYASILYLSTVKFKVNEAKNKMLITDLRVGALGLGLAENTQTWLHEMMNDNDTKAPHTPRGWPNQISEGGELTGLYSVTYLRKRKKLDGQLVDLEIVTGHNVRAGYNVGYNYIVNIKLGKFDKDNFIHNIDSVRALWNEAPSDSEHFAYVTLRPHFVFYNALLNGQLRDSAYTLSSDEIRHFVFEGEVGCRSLFEGGLGFNIFAANITSEISVGKKRTHYWAGMSFDYTM